MATIRSRIEHHSGIPLGGLGTGSMEIRGDGCFHEWQVFNLGQWAPKQPEGLKAVGPEMGPGAFAFFLRTRQGLETPLLRRLGLRTDAHDLYSLPWAKSVEEIEYEGRYPVAKLKYLDPTLPVSLEATLFSPFIPHDSRTSGTPGFQVVFRARNLSDQPVELALAATLANPLAWGAANRKLVNSIVRDGRTTHLVMRTSGDAPCKPTLGSMALSVAGGEASYILGDYPGFLRCLHYWSQAYGHTVDSFLHVLREKGRLPNLPGATSPAGLAHLSDEALEKLPGREQEKLISQLRRYPSLESLHQRIHRVAPAQLRSQGGRTAFLKEIRAVLNRLEGSDRTKQTWGDAALCSNLALAPQEEREVVFALAWHFPNHYSALGPVLGHKYEQWFRDAEEVSRFLAARFEKHRRAVCAFAETLYDTNLPSELADAWSGQLSTLAKCTWWTRKGDFAVWEGLGCCGFHTTDITYQGSFGLLALFPDLQQSQMELGARFQREDGRVRHCCSPDLSKVDNGFDRVDMNQQFVLLVCRDYLWTGDRAYLKRLWPNIVRAMDNTARLDGDGDGLPDHDTRRNTYDAWNFFGTPSYIASLWLAALLAAARLAEELGDATRAARWRILLKKGVAAFEKKLWNGEYYSLWVDGARRDECCMSDQIDGEWFTQLIGLGHCLPLERIQAALGAILRHNFHPEEGLINACYPPGRKPMLSTYRNVQALAPWTGIEYAMAAMMMENGFFAEGVAVTKSIHERYLRAGRFWNHVECGDHYYRAMSSWAVLLAATGFKLDLPAGALTIAPPAPMSELRAPWVSASGWGILVRAPERLEVFCRAGRLAFRQLRHNLPGGILAARLNGKRLPARSRPAGGLSALQFGKPVVLKSGDRLEIG